MIKPLRLGAVLAAAGLATAATLAPASPASAASTCRSGTGWVNCFSITGNAFPNVHIGIDVYMSPQDAQSILDCPGTEFSAKIWGSDTFSDDFLFNMPLSAAWVFNEGGLSGLSAEFGTTVDAKHLDEDWDSDDDVYGQIKLRDCRTGLTRTFNTNQIHDDF
jgi:hypothetical protein